MEKKFEIDGLTYKIEDLSEDGKTLLNRLAFANLKLHELKNQDALLTKAKNAYISDIKFEVVQNESGFDLGNLFDEDWGLENA